MLERLRRLLETGTSSAPTGAADRSERVKLAHVVLLLEAAWSDETLQPEEQTVLRQLLRQRFDLDDDGVARLLAVAADERRRGHDHFSFTRTLTEGLSHAERLAVLGDLWRVVYADGVLEAHEDALLHKFARLLDLSHQELIALKLRVRDGR